MSESNYDKIARWVEETFWEGQVIVPISFDMNQMPASSHDDYLDLIGKEGVIVEITTSTLGLRFEESEEDITIMIMDDRFKIVRGSK